tara:strand:+ start:360 stop:620 length:261 start_codon:yes stop_codon:yes gene_type:complete
MKRSELVLKAKELNIKGVSRMRKNQLEWAIQLHECASWFNDIAGNKITINDNEEDFDLEIIDLNKPDLTDFKMWDIPIEKQKWLIT